RLMLVLPISVIYHSISWFSFSPTWRRTAQHAFPGASHQSLSFFVNLFVFIFRALLNRNHVCFHWLVNDQKRLECSHGGAYFHGDRFDRRAGQVLGSNCQSGRPGALGGSNRGST